ncbi:MAG: hypothetical protein IJ869_05880 [Clostridiales bacterium]|nr:hypothetical protein [Clostridiales bacterium]
MKKLYVNIEDIDIRGSVTDLTDMVNHMDNTLQDAAQSTEIITTLVVKYNSSNAGQQYSRMVAALMRLRDELYDASISMNEMENEIVIFQNKVMRYEGMLESVSAPNRYRVERARIHIEESSIQFRKSEMVQLSNELNSYGESLFYQFQSLARFKDEIGQIWRDSQYSDFAEFIDEVGASIFSGLSVFAEYLDYLNAAINELE